MVAQARARNATALQSGRVDLRRRSVESLPFEGNSFDKALAINSMQVWPDAVAGLREMRTWRQDRAWLYALFGAGERRTEGSAHRGGLHERSLGGDKQRVLCAGDKTVKH